MENKQYLSFSSIDTLIIDPRRWYKEKILGQRENEFHDYFVRGKAVHMVIDHFNKTWDINPDIATNYVKSEVHKEQNKLQAPLEDWLEEKILKDTLTAIENYFSTNPKQATESEVEMLVDFGTTGVMFKGYIDAINEFVSIDDYKVVGSFTDVDNDWKGSYAKYVWQWHFYLLAHFIKTGKWLPNFNIIEILYKEPDLLKCRKDTIIQMAKDKGIENPEGTIPQMVVKYGLRPKVVNVIEIPLNQDYIEMVKKQWLAAVSMYHNFVEKGQNYVLYAMNKLDG